MDILRRLSLISCLIYVVTSLTTPVCMFYNQTNIIDKVLLKMKKCTFITEL